jgi:tRNA dimethylallyltransferase
MSGQPAIADHVDSRAHAQPPRPRVGFIVGPTGVGKTALAITIAERLGAEIVNADSRQVYRGMDLGTAKPSQDERRRVPHHLIDIRTPDQPLDAAEFARLARDKIEEITVGHCAVLIVGGSGLYVRALRGGIFAGPPASRAVRADLTEFAARHGTRTLHARLVESDPAAAARISPEDLKRIVRALEVLELTGVPISVHHAGHRFAACPYDTLTVGVTMPRDQLYATIDRRFDSMIESGLVNEVRELIDDGRCGDTLASTIGYREIASYLGGKLDLASAIDRAKRESRRFAKRQLTWFRAEPGVVWLDARDAVAPTLQLFTNFFENGTAPQRNTIDA